MKREFSVSKSIQIMWLLSATLFIALAIYLWKSRGFSTSVLIALPFSVMLIIKIIRARLKPLFVISDEELIISRPFKVLTITSVSEVREIGKNTIELIIADTLPVPLFLNELSISDRVELKSIIVDRISNRERN